MRETTPRQVLYGLVALGFILVEIILLVGAAVANLVPVWWTISLAFSSALILGFLAVRWRQTAFALVLSIGLFIVWTVGTLILS